MWTVKYFSRNLEFFFHFKDQKLPENLTVPSSVVVRKDSSQSRVGHCPKKCSAVPFTSPQRGQSGLSFIPVSMRCLFMAMA